ncbi:sucrose nonfermenting 4-like protein [Arachis stenosperma]|uniref:sucrose nonfermenting 4-like protein n=1 Tax=Arachis stenosperma TaxID=217475 RepID=UPI0025AC9DDF|nr:sucrose nonfermenting 4-like protein [Arachis stenosperma]XP_057722082.1 sucrose nonfermenting 4-like protein [Arachis stenosperma]
MFAPVAETGFEGSGVSGPILIPKRFVWPYGGKRVYLSGSFTRWSEHILMSPMEGCPSVFQVTCPLMPGYHQYKFNVDGEWRHDEQQPVVSGNYGVVNTIYLGREPDMHTILSSETPGRSHMEVDSVIFGHVEANPSMSDSDLEVSRHRVSEFLSTHTAYELLPDSGKVVALDINLPVKQAFHVLYEQGISIAPLWDYCRSQFVGVLSAMDFILMLKELGNHGSNLTEEQLETHTIAAWKEGKLQHHRTLSSNGGSYPWRFVYAGPHECLKVVALKVLQNKVSTVPIIHSSADDGSFHQLLHLSSLSGVLKCICRHFKYSSGSLPILRSPIGSIPLGTRLPKVGELNGQPLAMLRPNASLGAALSMFVQAEVSSIPIVDDNDSLLDIYSRSDITALAKDKAYARISLDEISIHQALLLRQDANSPYGLWNGQRCHMCLKSDSLQKVMERLANPGVRRLVIVEAGSKRVEGIISLSDVFKFLLG